MVVLLLCESCLFDSADALQNACVDFAKSEGYVVNQRELGKKKRWTVVGMCAQNYYDTKQGGGGVGPRQNTENNTRCPFRMQLCGGIVAEGGGFRQLSRTIIMTVVKSSRAAVTTALNAFAVY